MDETTIEGLEPHDRLAWLKAEGLRLKLEAEKATRGGAPCAKEILCLPPAKARAHIETLKAEHAARYKHILKDAMLEGFEAIGQAIRDGIGLSTEQMQCYHRAAAVLDQWPKFERAYDALRASLIDEGVKAEIAGEKF